MTQLVTYACFVPRELSQARHEPLTTRICTTASSRADATSPSLSPLPCHSLPSAVETVGISLIGLREHGPRRAHRLHGLRLPLGCRPGPGDEAEGGAAEGLNPFSD